MSFPPGTEMFQFPGFASHAYGFSVRYPIAGVGCPIRRSSDQSLLAAPQGLSQRATSFIASWRQGIHQMPLLSSTHPSDNRTARNPKLAPGTSRRPPPPGWTVQATTSLYKRPSRQERTQGPAYPCLLTRLPTDGRRGAEHVACQRPSTQRCTQARERTCMPADGLYHHHTMSKEQDPCRPAARGIESMPQPGLRGRGFPFGTAGPGPKPRGPAPRRMRAWWAWADLNGRPHAYQACALTS